MKSRILCALAVGKYGKFGRDLVYVLYKGIFVYMSFLYSISCEPNYMKSLPIFEFSMCQWLWLDREKVKKCISENLAVFQPFLIKSCYDSALILCWSLTFLISFKKSGRTLVNWRQWVLHLTQCHRVAINKKR